MWELDGSSPADYAADATGHDRTLNLTPAATGIDGAIAAGHAVAVNATDRLDTLPPLPATTQLAIEEWVQTTTTADQTVLTGTCQGCPGRWQLLLAAGGQPSFQTAIGDNQIAARASAPVNDGRWHQLASTVTYDTTADQSTVELYIDGTIAASVTHTGQLSDPDGKPFALDSNPVTFAGDYTGSLDELSDYDHPLTATQIHAHYVAAVGTAPANTSTPRISDGDAGTLTVTDGTWDGTQPLTLTYQWQRCARDGSDCADIANAATSGYATTDADKNHKLRVTVTATNRAGTATATSPLTATIGGEAPENTTPPTLTGAAGVNNPLSVNPGAWAGVPTPTFTYQWQRASGEDCADIDGETGPNYRQAAADVAHTLRVRVTATNKAGSATATSVKVDGPPATAEMPAAGDPNDGFHDGTPAPTPLDGGGGQVTIGPDGNIIIVGSVGENPAVSSKDAAGNDNPTAGGGTGTSELSQFNDSAFARAAVQNGKVVLAGSDSSGRIVVLRLNDTLTLDHTFHGTDGYLRLTVDDWHATSVIGTFIDTDNRILVVAEGTETDGTQTPRVLAFASDGTPDTSFGDDGVATPSRPNGTAGDIVITSAAYSPHGNTIVLAGRGADTSAGQQTYLLGKLDATGQTTTWFGSRGDGWVMESDMPLRPMIQVNPQTGQILAGGDIVRDGRHGIILRQYLPDGTRDPGFGNDGTCVCMDEEPVAIVWAPNYQDIIVVTTHTVATYDNTGSYQGPIYSSPAPSGGGTPAPIRDVAVTPDNNLIIVGWDYELVCVHGQFQWVAIPVTNDLGPTKDQDKSAGDPVNVVTGNVTNSEQDLGLPGRGIPLDFTRHYNSFAARAGAQTTDAGPSAFGPGWTFSYDTALTDAGETVTVTEPTGALHTFTRQPDGSYTAPYGDDDRLVKTAGTRFELTRPNGDKWTFQGYHLPAYNYDAWVLRSITDPNGNTVTLRYAADGISSLPPGQLVSVSDPTGRRVQVDWTDSTDTNGDPVTPHIAALTDYADRTVHYTYDSHNRLASVTDTAGAETTYEYDTQNQLVAEHAPGSDTEPGFVSHFDYDDTGRAKASWVDDHRRQVSFTYDPVGQQTLATDVFGKQTVYHYDSAAALTDIAAPDGSHLRSAHDSHGNKTAVIDQAGKQTDLQYDAYGNTTKITQPAPRAGAARPTSTMTYAGPFHRISDSTDADGGQMHYAYDARGNLETVTDARGKQTRFSYDTHGQRLSQTDAKGNTTTYTHDNRGNVTTVTDALGRTTTFEYDTAGDRLASTDATGRKTTYAYDTAGRLHSTTVPPAKPGGDPTTARVEYDQRGNITATEDADGNWTRMSYTPDNQLASSDDGTVRYEYRYDAWGNLREQINTNSGLVTRYGYDALARQTTTTRAYGTGDAVTTETRYDTIGRPHELLDGKNHSTVLDYDALGRLVQVTDPAGQTSRYEYSPAGLMLSETNPNGHATSYAYDQNGNLRTKRDALDRAWTYTYDDTGNLATITDAKGQVTALSYDPLNRLLETGYPSSSTHPVVRHYDRAGNLDTVSDATGTTTYDYDDRNQRLAEHLPNGDDLAYSYDDAGRRSTMTLPDYGTVHYQWEAGDRLASLTDARGHKTVFNYDDQGRSTGRSYGGGQGEIVTYDALGRVATVQGNVGAGQTLQKLTYAYDKDGNVTQVTDKDGSERHYDYDALDRLVHETTASHDTAYTYDPAGNRLSKTTDGQTTAYTYDADEQMLTAGEAIYTYDADGQLATKAIGGQALQFAYDAAGNLARAGAATFTYDYQGRQASSTVGAVTTTRTYDGQDMVQKRAGAGDPTTYVRDLAGQLISRDDPVTGQRFVGGYDTGLTYYFHDALGSVIGTSNVQKQVRSTSSYDAFGNPDAVTGAPDALGWMGNESLDGDSGLDDFHARAYDPAMGRFTSSDPVAGSRQMPQTLNPYVYGANNPMVNIDPYGLCFAKNWGPLGASCAVLDPAGDLASAGGHEAYYLGRQGWKHGVVPAANWTWDNIGRPAWEHVGRPLWNNRDWFIAGGQMLTCLIAPELCVFAGAIGTLYSLVNAGIKVANGHPQEAVIDLIFAAPGMGAAGVAARRYVRTARGLPVSAAIGDLGTTSQRVADGVYNGIGLTSVWIGQLAQRNYQKQS